MHEGEYSVLIVNQDPAILILLSAMLDNHGFRSLTARSLGEAVELTERHYVPVDLVLCDILVSGYSGDTVMNHLRQLRPGLHEIYISTPENNGAIKIQVMRKGLNGEFSPAGEGSLIEQVKKAIGPSFLKAGAF